MKKLIFGLGLLAYYSLAQAQSPVGQWQTVNEDGEIQSVVEIWQEGGELQGKIIELIDPAEPDPVCVECKDEKKDQPIVGLTIIWGLSQSGDTWEDGYILDPNNGVTYNSRLRLGSEDELEVRGYVGIAALGRTQVWYRAE